MRLFRHIAVLGLVLCGHAGVAQSVQGTAVVDGKKVELLDDGTWRFAAGGTTDPECTQLNPVVEFCGTDRWRKTNVPSTDFLAAYQLNARAFGGIIYEGIGSDDGINAEFMRNVLIQYAATASGVPQSSIPFLDVVQSSVDGQNAETMAYALQLNGLDVVYQNTMVIAEKHTIQFLVWTIGTDYTDEQKAVAEDFVENMRVDLGSQ